MEALSLNLLKASVIPDLRQGGGLRIDDGNVQLTNCNIYSNEANGGYVSTCPAPNPHLHVIRTRAPVAISRNFLSSPHGSTFLAPSESERRSSGRAAASTSPAATCSSPAATSTRTRRALM
jgi:hypothetical protein